MPEQSEIDVLKQESAVLHEYLSIKRQHDRDKAHVAAMVDAGLLTKEEVYGRPEDESHA